MADFAGEIVSLGLIEDEMGGETLSLLLLGAPLSGEQVVLCKSSE